ncbi:MAG: hypothetical protein KAG70_12070, partial [Alcanivorax sp.]|nr:hypothetical protein [Alcanivorax sp.]
TEPRANCTDPAFDGAVRLRLSAPYAICIGGHSDSRFCHPHRYFPGRCHTVMQPTLAFAKASNDTGRLLFLRSQLDLK